MNNQLEVMQALLRSTQKEIETVQRLLSGRVVSINIMVQAVSRLGDGFSHQVLYSRGSDMQLPLKWLADYHIKLQADRALIEQEINALKCPA